MDIDKEIARAEAKGVWGRTLDIVPNGSTKPLEKIFKELNLDPKRLRRNPSWAAMNHVVFVEWQISPSYLISIMTAINDPRNSNYDFFDLRRHGYGVRIKKMPKGGFPKKSLSGL